MCKQLQDEHQNSSKLGVRDLILLAVHPSPRLAESQMQWPDLKDGYKVLAIIAWLDDAAQMSG